MHGTFQIMLSDIMSVYAYGIVCTLCKFGKDSQHRQQASTLDVVATLPIVALSMSYKN